MNRRAFFLGSVAVLMPLPKLVPSEEPKPITMPKDISFNSKYVSELIYEVNRVFKMNGHIDTIIMSEKAYIEFGGDISLLEDVS